MSLCVTQHSCRKDVTLPLTSPGDILPVGKGAPFQEHGEWMWGSQKSNMCPQYQRRQWQPTPVLLPGKSHGWRSLVGYSPWGREESDRAERLHFHFSLSCIGEGNGNPLQCSCLVPDKELCLREALAVCTPPAPESSAKRPGS